MSLGELYSVDFKNRAEPAVSSGCPVPVFLNISFELTPVLQGVQTRYDILWSPRWPTKVDFHVQKKVAAHLGGWDIWVLSIFFQKSNIGWPQQPLTSRLPDTSKNLDSIHKKGPVIVILVPGGMKSSRSGIFWGKMALEVAEEKILIKLKCPHLPNVLLPFFELGSQL